MDNNISIEKCKDTCSFATTGSFEHLAGGFTAHCGPVAVTNVILTYWMRHGRPDLIPRDVFLWTADFGKHHLFYFNGKFLHLIGGTSDILSGAYLYACLRHFGIYNMRISPVIPLTPRLLREVLKNGNIAYVQLHHHPKYKNHHLIVYASDGDAFIAADGWMSRPVTLSSKDLRLGGFRVLTGI